MSAVYCECGIEVVARGHGFKRERRKGSGITGVVVGFDSAAFNISA